MSRIAKNPIPVPSGVDVQIGVERISVKGPKGHLHLVPHPLVKVDRDGEVLKVTAQDESQRAVAMSGTMRALVNNMVTGVSRGFERKLTIIGVGYRAQAQGKKLNLTLGFSHPVVYDVPENVEVETPSQTEILVKGPDKQKVGQVAADIRKIRKPEPYKGKGIRYKDERIRRKAGKAGKVA